MRFPWTGPRQENSELEALQTDVMRFIAILGLCLAAIFSLVHSAAREHREVGVPLADVLPVAPVEVDPAPRRPTPAPVVEAPREVQAPPEIQTPAKSEEESGFTLEFASGEALLSLLGKGDVKLYVSSGEQFWTVDERGEVVAVPAPGQFYQMAADTVPRVLRGAAPGEGTPSWGVTLSQTMRRSIVEIVYLHDHGNLAITASGEVVLDADQK